MKGGEKNPVQQAFPFAKSTVAKRNTYFALDRPDVLPPFLHCYWNTRLRGEDAACTRKGPKRHDIFHTVSNKGERQQEGLQLLMVATKQHTVVWHVAANATSDDAVWRLLRVSLTT